MTKEEIIEIKELGLVHHAHVPNFSYTINENTLSKIYDNYRVAGESKYYTISKVDSDELTKYKAYRTYVDRENHGFKFINDNGELKHYDLGEHFYSDRTLYLDGNEEIFHCKSDEERIQFILKKRREIRINSIVNGNINI